MNRRGFIKLSGLATVSFLTSSGVLEKLINQPAMAQLGNRIYKGTRNGEIVYSKNAGKTWQVHSNFGEEVSLLDLSVDQMNRVVAQLGYKNHIFHLRLTSDGLKWRST